MPRNITVSFADGTSHVYQNAPDDLTPDQVSARAQKDFGKKVTALDGGRTPEADTSAASGFLYGARDVANRISHRMDQIPVLRDIRQAVHVDNDYGTPEKRERQFAANRAEMANNTRTGYQTAGQIAATIPLARLGVAGGGAATGAIMSDRDDALGVATDAGIGAATSVVGGKLLKGIGSVVKGVKDKGLQALNKAGVPITLGQLARATGNSTIAGLESAGRRLPFLKQAVQGAEQRGQTAYYDSVVKRIGVDIPEDIARGHDALDYAGKKLSSEYQTLLPKLNIEADDKLARGLAKVGQDVKGIAPSSYNQFKSILKTTGLSDTGGVNLTGAKMQQADRVLREQSERFARGGPNDQTIADGLNQVRQQLRSLAQRQNPDYASELSSLNKRWRELAIARKAAGDPNAGSGVFTPAKYSRAAKGSRSNQELTRAANTHLTNRSPDSGTAESVGLGYLAAGSAPSPLIAAGAAGIVPYTQTGMRALNSIAFAPRRDFVSKTGTAISNLSRYAPQVVAPLAVSRDQ